MYSEALQQKFNYLNSKKLPFPPNDINQEAKLRLLIDDWGEEDFLTHIDHYLQLCNVCNYKILDAYLQHWDLDELGKVQQRYYGGFDTPELFVEFFANVGDWLQHVPEWVTIDWGKHWREKVQQDFIFEDGQVFYKNR